MSNHMQPTTKFDNQKDKLDDIKRTAQVKRQAETYSNNPPNKQRRYENTENNYVHNNDCVIKYVPTRREVDSLVVDNYLFQRVSATTNKDGSIGWRCKEYRTNTKCQSTCRIGVDGQVIRRPSLHNHACVSDVQLVFMRAKADAKKRCRTEDNISVQKIFLQEMGKAILSSGLALNATDLQVLPKFEANKRCLQIQRKLGQESKSTSNSENGDADCVDENSVESEGLDGGSEAGEVKGAGRKDINCVVSGLWERSK